MVQAYQERCDYYLKEGKANGEKEPQEPNYHCSFDEILELETPEEACNLIIELQSARRNLSRYERQYQLGKLCPTEVGRLQHKPFTRFCEKHNLKQKTGRNYRYLAESVDVILKAVKQCESGVDLDNLRKITEPSNNIQSVDIATQVRWKLLYEMSYSPGTTYFKNLSGLITSGLSPLNVVKFLNYSFEFYETSSTKDKSGQYPRPPEIQLNTSVRYDIGKYGTLVDYHVNGTIAAKIEDGETKSVIQVPYFQVTAVTEEQVANLIDNQTNNPPLDKADISSNKKDSKLEEKESEVSSLTVTKDIDNDELIVKEETFLEQKETVVERDKPDDNSDINLEEVSTKVKTPQIKASEIELAITLLEQAADNNSLTLGHWQDIENLLEKKPEITAIA